MFRGSMPLMSENAVGAATDMQPSNGLNGGIQGAERTDISYAFEVDEGQCKQHLADCRKDAAETVIRWAGTYSANMRRIIAEHCHFVLPARNEGKNVRRVLEYLTQQHGIDASNITLLDCSDKPNDTTATHARSFGIEPVFQDQVMDQLFDEEKLLDLTQSDKVQKGKGLTLTAASAHLYASGTINANNERDRHIVWLDTDPQDYGIGRYDPVGGFAYVREQTQAGTIKPAKSRRNNQPVYVGINALGVLSKPLQTHMEYVGRQPWKLSGEMSRTATSLQHLVMSSGYPVETTMNFSDGELGMKAVHYADGPLRSDGANNLEKETVMYTQILRTLAAVHMWCKANIDARLANLGPVSPRELLHTGWSHSYKRLIDFDATDVRAVNEILSREVFEYIPDETSELPGPVTVANLQESRLLGNLRALRNAGVLGKDVDLPPTV